MQTLSVAMPLLTKVHLIVHTSSIHIVHALAQAVPNDTSPHASFVSLGALHSNSKGTELILHTTDCLCLNQSECQPPNSRLYPYTHQV